MIRRAKHDLKFLLAAAVVFFLVAAAAAVFFLSSADPSDRNPRRVVVAPAMSVREIQGALSRAGVLKAGGRFLFFAKLSGWESRIQAGIYDFSPSDSWLKLLFKLRFGQTVQPKVIRVTFPEGASIYKMGILLREAGFSRWNEFQDLAVEGITPSLREDHRDLFKYISSESLEGYLYPDTYLVFENASAEALAYLMLNRFREKVLPFWRKAGKSTSYTLHEILTLASIIEKEAALDKERPVIASVFHNRLKLGMPLAADPTVKYALERPTKIVYLDQLAVLSPYTTYQRRGLPPGPICNPSLDSIAAAVYPGKTRYLYFVARADGGHIFSASWAEHQRARKLRKAPGPDE